MKRGAVVVEKLRFVRALIFFLASCAGIRVTAQVSAATVAGVVQDSSKAGIPDANVRLINTQTGAENGATTTRDGGFVLPGVMPGAYTLQIERQGFATTQLRGVILEVGDTKNLLIRMKVGPVAESVTVDATGFTLNSTDGSVSTVVDRKLTEAVPLNGRSFQDLISMTPGIVTQNPQAAGRRSETQGDFSVNGQRPESNSFFVDGISADSSGGVISGSSRTFSTGSAAGATALGTTQSLVSVEALQEFRVLTSSYSAEYGRTPGGQFTFLTRSGTNVPHGSFFYNYRSNAFGLFDAIDWFEEHQNASAFVIAGEQFTQNDFGGTFGGPVVLPGSYNGRDKTFLFLSYEGLYVPQPTPQTFGYGPLFFNLEQPPAAVLPVVDCFPPGYIELYDTSGNPSGLGIESIQAAALPAHLNSTSIRADHTFSPKLSMFLRYGDAPSYSQTNQLFSLTANQLGSRTVSLGVNTQLSTDINNELRLGFAANNSSVQTNTEPYYFNGPNLNSALGIPNSYDSVSSEAYIHILGVGDSDSYTNAASASLNQWNLRDTFNLQAGKHLVKLGMDERRVVSNVRPAALSVQADFFAYDAMLYNSLSDLVVTTRAPASPILNRFSLFAQDDWKMSKSLSLSLGLRWEVAPPPKGEHGQDAYTILGNIQSPATLRVALRGTPLWHMGWYNFAPRAGVAWAANREPGRELVLRAGGGVFFDTGNGPALRAFSGLGFANSAHFANVPLPVTQLELNVAPPSTDPSGANAFAFPSHLQLPYSRQWNISLEKALGKSQTLTASYVGASGQRLLEEQRRNVSQVNPGFADITFFPSGLTSSYEAMQIKFQRTLVQGVQSLVSYTWAHALDYGSTDPAFPLIRGNSDLDVRHNVEAAISWDLPGPDGSYLRKNLFEGWRIDGRLLARTGFPVDLSGNFFLDPITGNTYDSGVDLIPNRPLYFHSNGFPGRRTFNGGVNATNPAFVLPQGNAQGDAPRNLARGFGALQENIGVRRAFHLHDSLNLQVGTEVFNVTNHPNFGYIDPYLPDLLFGQPTKLLNQSFGTTGSLYQQGGPRSIQLSLRLVF